MRAAREEGPLWPALVVALTTLAFVLLFVVLGLPEFLAPIPGMPIGLALVRRIRARRAGPAPGSSKDG